MKTRWIATPYIVWMIIFTVVPLLLVFFFSVTVQTDDGIVFTLEHFKKLMEPIYLKVLLRSILLAFVSTLVCLVLGYPMAMILASSDLKRKNVLVFLFVAPMWMNFLLRTYAWLTLLEKNGLINSVLSIFGIKPLNLLYNNLAVLLGMVYNFLPFMVLPIYSVLSKVDKSVIEAAQDLGANNFKVFTKVTFPLSLPGVASGITMVFMPAVTTFVVPRLLGGAQFTLIGNLIERQFVLVGDWNFGSAISIVMMILILISMGIMSRYETESVEGGFFG